MDYNKIAQENAGILPEGIYPEKINKFWGCKTIVLMDGDEPKQQKILTPLTKTSSKLLYLGRVNALKKDGCEESVAKKAANMRSGMKIWRKAVEIKDVAKYIQNPSVKSKSHFKKVFNANDDGLNIHELRNAVRLSKKV